MLLRLGDKGESVALLQQHLRRAGFKIDTTHVFDKNTENAVRALQARAELVIDGIVGKRTMRALHMTQASTRDLRDIDLHQAAIDLDVPIAAIRAVNEVESRGQGFHDDGRPIILFERHVFWRRLVARHIDPSTFGADFAQVLSRKPGGYQGGAAEHTRLGAAVLINADAAHESCSWGLFQVMGFHWQRLGFADLRTFLDAMWRDEAAHLNAFVRFVQTDPNLHAALRAGEWAKFARRYNGPAYARNQYDVKLARIYARYTQDSQSGPLPTAQTT